MGISGPGSTVQGVPGGSIGTTVPGKTGVALDVSVKRTSSKDVRLATAEDVQEVLIDFLDPRTLQPVIETTRIKRTAPSVEIVIEVPVGTWILRIQGRTASGEVAGSRFETTITVVEGQTTEAVAELNPATTLAAIQVAPGPTSLAAQNTTVQFTATGILTDLTTQSVAVTWSSSNPAVANISANGLATALSAGTTIISARSGNVTGISTLTVTPTGLKSLQVTPNPVDLSPGLTQQLTATGLFEDGTNQNVTDKVTWTSSSSNVAAVNASGVVTAASVGNATITATLGNVTASTVVRVKPQLRSLTLTPANVSLPVGLTQAFKATGVFSDDSTEDLTNSVTWTSASNATATVTNTGLLTAVAPGTTSVTAASGNITATASVQVTPVQLTRLSITPPSATLPKGAVQAFNATGVFNNNTTRDVTAEVTWTSTNTNVAAISNANGTRGEATAVNAGSTVVEATLDGLSASATVTVTPATLISIAVSPAQPEVGSGDLVIFKATGTYSDGTSLDITNEVTWSSGNVSVAVISNAEGTRGQATSIASGVTTVTATLGAVSASTTFTTRTPTPPPPVIPSPSPSPAVIITASLMSYNFLANTQSTGSANFGGRSQAISADGRYVAFIGPGTIDNDPSGQRGVFRRDTTTGAVVRCSLTSTGAVPTLPAAKQYFDVAISDDGSKVCFTTNQQLVPNDFGNTNTIQDPDVYVRDLTAGTTTLVSLDAGGLAAKGYSRSASISGNGSVVAFEFGPGAFASNYVNVFRSTTIGAIPTPLVADPLPNGNELRSPQLNTDGSVLALDSNVDLGGEAFAPPLAGQRMVFRWTAGVFTRISRAATEVAPAPPAGNAFDADISGDGGTIAFTSNYAMVGSAHFTDQIYCWNSTGIERVSVEPTVSGGSQACNLPGISSDGRYVAYLSIGDQMLNTLAGAPTTQWGTSYREAWVRDRVSTNVGRLTYTTSIGGGGGAVNEVSIAAGGAGVALTTDAAEIGLIRPILTAILGQVQNVVLVPNSVFNGASDTEKPPGSSGGAP